MNQKPKITLLSLQWRQWIQDNLARGCTVDSMTDAMAQQNFDRAAAAGFIRQVATASLVPADSANSAPDVAQASVATVVRDSTYVYESPRLAQSGSLIKTPDRDVRVSLRMTKPVVAVFDNILSSEECDELIRLSRIKLKRSTIVDPKTGKEDEFIINLERRIGAVMNWPVENGEGLQILNYKVGGEYKPHFDYFPPGDPGSAVHLAKGGQRVSTMVIYLNDVEEAGETTFPDVGLSVSPKKGAAVYFKYCNSHNQVDPLTLHAGAPVAAGEKWIATKWMRQRRYG